jgi:hypothetical protein
MPLRAAEPVEQQADAGPAPQAVPQIPRVARPAACMIAVALLVLAVVFLVAADVSRTDVSRTDWDPWAELDEIPREEP